MIPGKMVKGTGGAMDLLHGARRVLVLMEHSASDGSANLVSSCTLPLTGKAVIQRVITDLGLLDVDAGCFRVVELAPLVSRDEIAERIGAPVVPARDATGPALATRVPLNRGRAFTLAQHCPIPNNIVAPDLVLSQHGAKSADTQWNTSTMSCKQG